jgi:hypothetical protein
VSFTSALKCPEAVVAAHSERTRPKSERRPTPLNVVEGAAHIGVVIEQEVLLALVREQYRDAAGVDTVPPPSQNERLVFSVCLYGAGLRCTIGEFAESRLGGPAGQAYFDTMLRRARVAGGCEYGFFPRSPKGNAVLGRRP